MYETALIKILTALVAWLTLFNTNPAAADPAELQRIMTEYNALKADVPVPSTTTLEIAGWIFPGAPACGALLDAKNSQISVLKPEFFRVNYDGELELLTVENSGCNGFSVQNLATIKSQSNQQYVTVASLGVEATERFFASPTLNQEISRLVSFAVNNNLSGIEIDFEDYGSWSPALLNNYLNFLTTLGQKLHQNQKKLIVDVPAVRNQSEANWYPLKYQAFNNLPVDEVVIMGYDYQYDYGIGEPVAPLKWLEEVVRFAQSQLNDRSKISVGLPNYGYLGNKNTGKITLITREEAKNNALYGKLVRDKASGELIASQNGEVLVVQDQEGLRQKIVAVQALGVKKVSIWHLGGGALP